MALALLTILNSDKHFPHGTPVIRKPLEFAEELADAGLSVETITSCLVQNNLKQKGLLNGLKKQLSVGWCLWKYIWVTGVMGPLHAELWVPTTL